MTRNLAPDALGPTLVVGEILVEIVAETRGDGFLVAQSLTGPYPSGAPAIFIDQCGRFGGKAAMIGAVGDDDFGRMNLARLSGAGVDVSAVVIDPDWPTGSAFVRYRTDGTRDFVYNIATSAAARFGWSARVADLVGRAGHLHVMGTALSMPSAQDVISRALPILRARGGTLSVDPNLRKELASGPAMLALFDRLVRDADLLLPSGEELCLAAGAPDEATAIDRLQAEGTGEIVIKRGAAGAACHRPGLPPVDGPAFVVTEVDPTGAGDCFGGAYVAARRLGLPVELALTYGCAAGARNVTFVGPMEGSASRAALDAFIRDTPRKG